MTEGTAAEWWIMKRLTESAAIADQLPGGVHPWPAPAQGFDFYATFRRMPGDTDSNSLTSERTMSDMSYEVVAVGNTGARAYSPLVAAQNAIDAALAVGIVQETGTITEYGTVPHMIVERIDEVREPEFVDGGVVLRKLGGVYRFRVLPDLQQV